MGSELLIAIIGIISTIVGSWASYFFTRRKYNSEVDNNVIENMKQSLEFYTKLSDDNKARLDEALKRNELLEQEIRELRSQVTDLAMSICYDLSCSARMKMPKNRLPKTKKNESN